MTDTDTKEALDALRREILAELAALRATMLDAIDAMQRGAPARKRKQEQHRPHIPNAKTIAAMEDPEFTGEFKTVDALMQHLHENG
jgi:hypothetical protein